MLAPFTEDGPNLLHHLMLAPTFRPQRRSFLFLFRLAYVVTAMKLLLSLLPVTCLAWADWCKWVPVASQIYVPECAGYGYPGAAAYAPWSYGCASWCRWVPGPSWGYTPQCVGCYQLYAGSYKSMAPPTAKMAAEKGCKTSCQWLSRVSWNSTADCAKCEQPLEFEATQPEDSAPSPRLKVKLQRPDWCQWVPLGSLQYVNDCNTGAVGVDTTATGGCAGWCGWSPVSSWQYIPECTQCSPNLPEGTAMVPSAGCANWCQWVSRPSWQYVGSCTGCEALAQANSNTQNEIQP